MILLRRLTSLSCAGALLLAVPSAEAQQLPEPRSLGAPLAISEPRSPAYSVRELSDGRVLATPWGNRHILLFDPTLRGARLVAPAPTGQDVTPFSATGLSHGGGDTTYVSNPMQGTIEVYVGSAMQRVIRPVDRADTLAYSGRSGEPRIVSGRWLVYALRDRSERPYADGNDSASVVAIDMRDGSRRTILRISMRWTPPPPPPGSIPPNGIGMIASNAEPAQDVWGTSPDGEIVALRQRLTRIDRFRPDGSFVGSTELALGWRLVTGVERDTLIARNRAMLARMRVNSSMFDAVPAEVPPVRPNGVVDSRGRLWVESFRILDPAADGIWYVIGRDGSVEHAVTISPRDRIVGFGDGTVYLSQRIAPSGSGSGSFVLTKFRMPGG